MRQVEDFHAFVRTDRGNAERLVAYHGRDFRHCGPWKKFMVWDECRWKLDDSGEVCRRENPLLARFSVRRLTPRTMTSGKNSRFGGRRASQGED